MSKRTDDRSPAPSRRSDHPLYGLLARGEYRRARAEARRLLAAPAAAEPDREAAREIMARTGVDPAALLVGLGALVLVAVVLVVLLVT